IAGERPEQVPVEGGAGGDAPVAAGAPAVVGQSYAGRTATATANANLSLEGAAGFALGTVVGGLLVGIGVLIGSRLGRRR
ncbi:hypothetical protein, partial [Phycicoccus elongatus]|uniref:hypothetical protein n=1 Tax=Phycicoccus elongatus TaxID=101689 RepID=UPI00059471E5